MNKSLVEPIRLFKRIAACVTIGSLSFIANAQHTLSSEDIAIIDQGKQLADQAKKLGVGSFIPSPELANAETEAKSLYQELLTKDKTLSDMQRLEAQKGIYREHKTLVFASQSLGEQSLDDLLRSVSGLPDAVVVFRGIPDGMNIGEGVLAIQKLAAKIKPIPNVIINPTLFKTYKVSSVPAIVMLENSTAHGLHPKPVAQVTGISDPAWLSREVNSGNAGDLGNRGPVVEIGEPDLIDVAKRKMATIDWSAKKQESIARFWDKQNFNTLPRAINSRVREIDPSIVITDDITAPDGSTIAKKGAVINPLDARPFTQTIIVFDPLDKKQMDLLDRAIHEIKREKSFQRLTLIATEFDKEKGWDSYSEVSNHFNAPIYLLTPDIISRFELEYTPSVITSAHKHFVVKELTIGDVEE